MNRIIYIYVLLHPVTKAVRYVGKTTNLKKRYENHIFKAKEFTKSRKIYNWIQKLLANDLKPEIKEVEQCSEDNWPTCERFWISYYKSIGCDLCNLTDGGESNYGYTTSDETRRVQSDAHKRRHKLNPPTIETKNKTKKALGKPVKCIDDNTVHDSIQDAAIFYSVPKTTFHRKLLKSELINGKQFIQYYNSQTPTNE